MHEDPSIKHRDQRATLVKSNIYRGGVCLYADIQGFVESCCDPLIPEIPAGYRGIIIGFLYIHRSYILHELIPGSPVSRPAKGKGWIFLTPDAFACKELHVNSIQHCYKYSLVTLHPECIFRVFSP